MGRSVDYLKNAETVIYFTVDWLAEEKDEYLSQRNYEDFLNSLRIEIMLKLKSYIRTESWESREVQIILSNELCNIGISNYCGMFSLSVAPKEFSSYYSEDTYRGNFSEHHARQIENTLVKCLKNCYCKLLNRVGTFSNGCGIYKEKFLVRV